jgi:molecular chaperone GrpE (heat shock protein)
MLDVDKAKQRLDGYVAEWSRNNCQTEHHRELIYHQAEQLENAGIEVTIPKIGSEFNPAHHRCTSHIPSPEPENTIILVDQVGLHGEGVRKRDALVVISSGPD